MFLFIRLLYVTSHRLYRKPTFTGLYTRWDSFGSTKQKINLIKTLTIRVLMIYSESTLGSEIKLISDTFANKSFLLSIIQTVIANKIIEFDNINQASVQKCPGCISLLWMGGTSERFTKKIKETIQRCYFSSNVRAVYHTKPILSIIRKDVLPCSS